jgi:hypothetical protein
VRTEDSALLRIPGAVLYNNVFGKGDIAHYRQSIFHGKNNTGWDWDWPDNGASEVKSYPEVLVGRSPWSDAGGVAGGAGLGAGNRLPRRLSESHQTIDFAATTLATKLWDLSFDFWITSSDHPTSKEIVSDLTIFAVNHGVEIPYKDRQMKLKIGGRTYLAIVQTPKEAPDKSWTTLCLVDTTPRSKGSLELVPLMNVLVAQGLAKATDFLATAELGNEVVYGKGRTTVRTFRLR